jgi:hypothetical protein
VTTANRAGACVFPWVDNGFPLVTERGTIRCDCGEDNFHLLGVLVDQLGLVEGIYAGQHRAVGAHDCDRRGSVALLLLRGECGHSMVLSFSFHKGGVYAGHTVAITAPADEALPALARD